MRTTVYELDYNDFNLKDHYKRRERVLDGLV